MTIQDIKAIIGALAFIIGLAFLVDARYERAGAARQAEISSKIFTLNMQVANRVSTIYRYTVLDSVGRLSADDAARRQQLVEERDGFIRQVEALQGQLDAL